MIYQCLSHFFTETSTWIDFLFSYTSNRFFHVPIWLCFKIWFKSSKVGGFASSNWVVSWEVFKSLPTNCFKPSLKAPLGMTLGSQDGLTSQPPKALKICCCAALHPVSPWNALACYVDSKDLPRCRRRLFRKIRLVVWLEGEMSFFMLGQVALNDFVDFYPENWEHDPIWRIFSNVLQAPTTVEWVDELCMNLYSEKITLSHPWDGDCIGIADDCQS